MEESTDLNQFYLKSFEEILGLSLKLNNDSSISIINLPSVISKINPISITNIISPIELMLEKESLHEKSYEEKTFYKKTLMTKYIYNLINPQAEAPLLDQFVEKLQFLSNRTYEQQPCQMGFILFNNQKNNIKVELSKLNIDYIPFDNPLTIDELDSDKKALKLINSLSLCYVVNSSYQITGIAKKQKANQSISSIMSNRHQKDEESLLKFNMYRYFINNHPNNTFNEYIGEIETQVQILEKEYNKLIIQLDQDTRDFISLKQNITNPSDLDAAERDYYSLSTKINNTVQEIRSLKYKQVEILIEKNSTFKTQMMGLEQFKNAITAQANKDIQFIQFKSNRIEWFINDSLICVLSNGKWRVKNYELISHIVLEFILRQYIENSDVNSEKFIKIVENITPRSKILFNNIRELSNNNVGALIVFLKQSKKQKRTIYQELLSKKELNNSDYKKIIQTDTSNRLNLYSCDNYLFELICSVDGAVLLDKYFYILSFGEMINNSIETPPVAEAGSRTLAAAKASRFGLSIKVSEDGDISLYEDGSPIIKL
ncbi:hypothetical protein COK06_22925 [Bacillus cereus]|nr:hypothetical protein COK06_22925 [Bacillus cereus]